MAMTSGAAAASADLDSLYRDLHAAHLHPLWRIERNLLTEHPMPRAIPWVWRAADMYPLGERAIRAVPVNRGGERRSPRVTCSSPSRRSSRTPPASWR
jgi:gentisate 1,2-dioxygenase